MNTDIRSAATMTIDLARTHLDKATMRSSAELCLSDAEYLFRAERYADAYGRALKSLDYSVGILHPDHRDAVAIGKKASR